MPFDLSFLSGLSEYIDPVFLAGMIAFVQVVFIDIIMAGDNAVAVGMAASGLQPDKRRLAIFFGLAGAIVTRITFVLLTVQLFKIVGLLLLGGFLLLGVCIKMWLDLRHRGMFKGAAPQKAHPASILMAITQILIADVSMSLDNVLAVTGAAEDHVPVLAFGLLFSIAAMGFAANYIASVLHRFQWIGYFGLVVVFLVALKMIFQGGLEVWNFGNCDASLKCANVMASDIFSWWHGTFQALFFHKS